MQGLTDDERIEELRRLSSGGDVWDSVPGPGAAAGTAIAKASMPTEDIAAPMPASAEAAPEGFDYGSLLDAGDAVQQPYDLSNPPKLGLQDSETAQRPDIDEASANTRTLADSITAPATGAAPVPQGDSKPQPQRDAYLDALKSISAGPEPDFAGIESKMAADRGQRSFDKLSNLIAAATSRRALTAGDFQSDASEASDAMKLAQMKAQAGDKKTQLQLALAKAMKGQQGVDPSLVADRESLRKYREGLLDIAKQKLAAGQAGQPDKDAMAKLKLELEQKRLEEQARHNQAAEGLAGRKLAKASERPKVAKQGSYDDVPEDIRETVKAIVDGRAKAPDPGSRFGAKVLNYVTQVDPTFDATKFGAYKDVREKLSKSDDVVALNTAYNHVSRAKQNVPDNFDPQSLNKIRQAWLTGSGSEALTPFETDVKIAADELAKAYGNNSEAGRSTIEHLLAPNQSKQQLQARLAEVEELLGGKLKSYQDQFAKAAPKGAKFDVVTPHEEPAAGAEKKTPGGKPFAKKQYSASKNMTRYLDAAGNVIETVEGNK